MTDAEIDAYEASLQGVAHGPWDLGPALVATIRHLQGRLAYARQLLVDLAETTRKIAENAE